MIFFITFVDNFLIMENNTQVYDGGDDFAELEMAIRNGGSGGKVDSGSSTLERKDSVVEQKPRKPRQREAAAGNGDVVQESLVEKSMIQIGVPVLMKQMLKIACLFDNKSMSQCVREALEGYLGDFSKRFRKSYEKDSEIMRLFSNLFSDTK